MFLLKVKVVQPTDFKIILKANSLCFQFVAHFSDTTARE